MKITNVMVERALQAEKAAAWESILCRAGQEISDHTRMRAALTAALSQALSAEVDSMKSSFGQDWISRC